MLDSAASGVNHARLRPSIPAWLAMKRNNSKS